MTMWAVLSCKIDSARHIFVFGYRLLILIIKVLPQGVT